MHKNIRRHTAYTIVAWPSHTVWSRLWNISADIFDKHIFTVRYITGPELPISIASQITSLTIVHSSVYSDADQGKHQSSASLAFVRGIHRRPVNSPHKGPVTRKMFPFDDAVMFSVMTVSSDEYVCIQIVIVEWLAQILSLSSEHDNK